MVRFSQVQSDQVGDLAEAIKEANILKLVAHLEVSGFHLALVANKIVGFVHFSKPKKGEVWLQAMRILPGYQNSGVGTEFVEYQLIVARDMGARVVRLMTLKTNEKIQWIIGSKYGFCHSGIYLRGRRASLQDICCLNRVMVVTAEIAEEIWAFWQEDSQSLVADDYDVQSYKSFDFDDLMQWIIKRRCLVVFRQDTVDGVLLFSEQERTNELFVNRIYAKTEESLIKLLDSIGFLAAYYGYTLGISVAEDRLTEVTRRWWKEHTRQTLREFIVFEKQLI